jgi:hypothetical protein
MKSIILPHNMAAIVDDEYYDILSKNKWCLSRGYANRKIYNNGNGKQTTIYMHRVVIELSGRKVLPGTEIDHISQDKLDNRKDNLRIITHSQNVQNRKVFRNNTSGYKGVSWNIQSKKWQSHITVGGILKNLGNFDNILDAAMAYDIAAKKLHKEFAVVNFIPVVNPIDKL